MEETQFEGDPRLAETLKSLGETQGPWRASGRRSEPARALELTTHNGRDSLKRRHALPLEMRTAIWGTMPPREIYRSALPTTKTEGPRPPRLPTSSLLAHGELGDDSEEAVARASFSDRGAGTGARSRRLGHHAMHLGQVYATTVNMPSECRLGTGSRDRGARARHKISAH